MKTLFFIAGLMVSGSAFASGHDIEINNRVLKIVNEECCSQTVTVSVYDAKNDRLFSADGRGTSCIETLLENDYDTRLKACNQAHDLALAAAYAAVKELMANYE